MYFRRHTARLETLFDPSIFLVPSDFAAPAVKFTWRIDPLMGAWTYKNYAIVQKNHRLGKRWVSTACFRTSRGELNLTAYPVKQEGYAQERTAQSATEKFVRDYIDNWVQTAGESIAERKQ